MSVSAEMIAAFTEQMAQLRQAIADADPLAAGADSLPAAQTVVGAFASAPEAERARYVLRALDDAIAAQEVAARLADELHGAGLAAQARAPVEGEADPLRAAYAAYAESQPSYQALYQYRNALAVRLRLEARPLPEKISGAPSLADEPGAPSEKPAAKSRHPHKETNQE